MAKNVDYVRKEDVDAINQPGTLHYDAELTGVQVQHDTITWYVRKDVLTDLQ